MLITKNIVVYGTPKNVSYYKKLGYDIKYHEYCTIDIHDLLPSSKIKVTIACDYCGSIFERNWCKYLSGHENIQKDSCPKCYGKKNAEIWRNRCDEDETYSSFINAKREFTMRERYGADNASQIEEFVNKKIATNIARYGCENPYQNKDIQKKMHDTMVERYGVMYSMQNADILAKSRQTCLRNYGVVYPMQSDEVLKKVRENNASKYGVEYSIASDVVQRKIRQTCLDRFGVEYPLQNQKVLEKTFETMRNNNYNFVLISKEQRKLAELFDCDINVRIGTYYADMLFKDDNVICEYDGGAHNLCVKFQKMTQDEFDAHEKEREDYIIAHGYKIIRIVNPHDKAISDELAFRIRDDGLYFLLTNKYNVYIYNIDLSNITYR